MCHQEITIKMGTEQSILKKNDYVLVRETENAVVATKGDETFLIKKVILPQVSEEFKLTLIIVKYETYVQIPQ